MYVKPEQHQPVPVHQQLLLLQLVLQLELHGTAPTAACSAVPAAAAALLLPPVSLPRPAKHWKVKGIAHLCTRAHLHTACEEVNTTSNGVGLLTCSSASRSAACRASATYFSQRITLS